MQIKASMAAVIILFFMSSWSGLPIQLPAHFSDKPLIDYADSLPLLHRLKKKEIDSVTSSFTDNTVSVTMKNGTTLVYPFIDWDYEDFYPTTDKRIANAIKGIQKTFVKTEHPPEFAGGEEAWNQYIQEFCKRNKQLIQDAGPAAIAVQFVVHLKGQVSQISIVSSDPSHSGLTGLAIKAIGNAPAWVPASQNGHPVICVTSRLVTLSQ